MSVDFSVINNITVNVFEIPVLKNFLNGNMHRCVFFGVLHQVVQKGYLQLI